MWWSISTFVGLLFLQQCTSDVKITTIEEKFYEIVGIFEPSAHVQRRAFNESMKFTSVGEMRLGPRILEPPKTDSYAVWRKLCTSKGLNPIAIFGPQSPISDGAVRDQCARAQIPHIQATWQPNDPDMYTQPEPQPEEEGEEEEDDEDSPPDEEDEIEEEQQEIEEVPTFKKISINFYPDDDELAMAFADVIRYYQWNSYAVLHEDDYGLLRVQKILARHSDKYSITVRRLDPNGDNQKVFKELKTSRSSRVLLDCHIDHVDKYMKEAEILGMLDHYRHYILTSLDGSILSDTMTHYQSNITWLSITNFESLKNTQHTLSTRVGKWKNDIPNYASTAVTTLQTEALLMDDVANFVLTALKDLPEEVRDNAGHPCEREGPWELGAPLQNQLLKTEMLGVTGLIKFNEYGKRVNYTLYVNEIHVNKRNTIAKWESATGELAENRSSSDDEISQTSKHFVIISKIGKPYFYKKENQSLEDSDEEEYEGFSVDLVEAIFDVLKNKMNLNYSYSFSKASYKDYGKINPETKKWEGLIGDLLDKKADLAVCDLTITEERKSVVDFSVPFMTLGISILYTKDHKVDPGTFSFLYPYSFDVWMLTATAYCAVSICLFVCSRISPADWENPQPCDKDPEELENIWNFKNCAWLTMGSIMTQGCDILPKAIGSRWVCGMWWFFAMIVCQTYIAQLAASMTAASEQEPINSVEDLAQNNKILYGALNGGSTLSFFKNSKDKMYQRMYENMMSNPAVLVRDNEEGERRVLSGKNKYAFFMESCTIEYKLKRNCELKKVGGELDSKDYGIAMPANSPFRSQINGAILRLKELTRLDEIKNHWWNDVNGAKNCSVDKDTEDVEGDLELKNLSGAFIVLVAGLFCSLVITAAEFMNEVRNIVVREQVTHKEAFIQELKTSLNFFQLQKPVLRNPSRAPSVAASAASDRDARVNARLTSAANFLDLEKVTQ
ncbi:glutamate receptor ionotropic, kainate 2 [Plutella xylostella]|uniref:glutamate receptor ionotropic, kainate 2 n=1 Tax=Plutella xylostella TaxID=51655 RepID=UPI002032B570|nr:glutamate receptor ionotropic, kainate 2 [Plutella xylostella]